jgi:phosphoribosylformylglycinamidine synthase I
MPKPRVLILRAPGTNCDLETAFAFQQAGAETCSFHINRLLESADVTRDCQILCIPGGFSYGDDVAAGRILGNQIRHHLDETLRAFKDAGKLILGICNGFQVLLKSGVLLADDPDSGPAATLTWNDVGKFEDRWAYLATDQNRCEFLDGIDRMYLPIAHAEGKFVTRDQGILEQLKGNGQLVLRYCTEDGVVADETLPHPVNPNGSDLNVAGMCDETGRVLGLMPHPERHIQRTHHPRWTRGEGQDPGDGLAVFENAVKYFA